MTLNFTVSRNISVLFLLALTVALTGCVSNSYWAWEHHDLNRNNRLTLAEDQRECHNLAHDEANRYDYLYFYRNYPYFKPYYRQGRYYDPFWEWQYHDRFFRYQNALDRYYRICMKAKGWSLIKKTKEQGNKTSTPSRNQEN